MATTAVIYARYSPRPRATECESIATQLNACRRHCGLLRLHVSNQYTDEALSGKRADNREGLQHALDAVCKSQGALVVYSLSRLARSTIDAVTISERLERAGADLISLRESVDTTTAAGRMMYAVMAAVAQWEREVAAERTSDAMQRHQSSGRRMSDRPPYGWRSSGTRLVEDESEQQTIKLVLDLRHQGLGSRAIVRELESRGVTSRPDRRRTSNRWYHSQVMRIVERAARDAEERAYVEMSPWSSASEKKSKKTLESA